MSEKFGFQLFVATIALIAIGWCVAGYYWFQSVDLLLRAL